MADDVARQGIYDRGVTAPSTPEMPRLSSSRRSLALDVVVAVVLLTCGLALLWFQYDQNNGTILPGVDAPDRNLAMIGLSLVVVPVAVRRLAPIGALALGAVAFVVVRWILVPEYQVTSIALFLLLYGAGRWSDRPRVRNGARAIAVVGLLVVLIRSLILEWDAFVGVVMSASRFALVAGVGLTFNVVFVLTSVLAGELARGRADRERDLAIRTLELQAEREENARRAVLDERVRIARELHDVVAHHVSVMGVQAGAARRVMSTQPAAAAEALEAVEESSRQAVVELHRLPPRRRRDRWPRSDTRAGSPRRTRRLGAFGRARRRTRDRRRPPVRARQCRRLGLSDRAGGPHERVAPRSSRSGHGVCAV